MRIKQWAKNFVIFAVCFFAWGDANQGLRETPWQVAALATAAFFVFCLVSSGVYIFNDLRDREADRNHPVKCKRPFASGALGVRAGIFAGALLFAFGFAGAWMLGLRFLGCVAAYLVLQAAYTLFLKRVALVDVVVIALGFVIRAAAGAAALWGLAPVRVSMWLLACTFLLALFLALCKRRHEKRLLGADGGSHRAALAGYSGRALDAMVRACAATVVACYAVYTLLPDTRLRFGTDWLWLTIPCVVLGVWRYLHLVYKGNSGGSPEKVFLTDFLMLAIMASYAAVVLAVMRGFAWIFPLDMPGN